jgi:hypothetical protein
MRRRWIGRRAAPLLFAIAMLASSGADAWAQAKPRPAPAARPSRSVQIGGYAMAGRIDFTAVDSFKAILGESSGPIFGGGARIGLPLGGLFADVGAWQFTGEGERVFVANGQTFPLGVPVTIAVTPIEIGAGWRFRIPRMPKFIPYAGGGWTSMLYKETSEFSGAGEDVDERFNGYHLSGGAEYKITRWLGVAGEVAWTTVPESIGEGGVSEAFNEDDLGGTTFRFKITIGR